MRPGPLRLPRWPRSAKLTAASLLVVLVIAAATIGRGADNDVQTAAPSTTATPSTATSAATSTTTSAATTSTSSSRTADPGGDGTAQTTTSVRSDTTTAPATTVPPSVLPLRLPDVPPTALVDRLVVAQPDPAAPPYVRDRFDGGGWAYDPATGCNTRERVLIEESLVPPHVDDRCRSTGGRWRSVYDGLETTDPGDLQIDHLVPLADAWRSGAWRWTPDQRLAFANDLSSPDTLLAVSASTNESKRDRTPDEWMPPARGSWCDYAAAWVRVKARWSLEVTPSEKATLVSILTGC